ncbi:hypothetical protein Tco_0177377, partial [Tanacetum coccineum]
MTSNSKIGLGYAIQSNNEVLSYEEEMNRAEDVSTGFEEVSTGFEDVSTGFTVIKSANEKVSSGGEVQSRSVSLPFRHELLTPQIKRTKKQIREEAKLEANADLVKEIAGEDVYEADYAQRM